MEKLKKDVLNLLKENGSITNEEMAKILNADAKKIAYIVRFLIEKGCIYSYKVNKKRCIDVLKDDFTLYERTKKNKDRDNNYFNINNCFNLFRDFFLENLEKNDAFHAEEIYILANDMLECMLENGLKVKAFQKKLDTMKKRLEDLKACEIDRKIKLLYEDDKKELFKEYSRQIADLVDKYSVISKDLKWILKDLSFRQKKIVSMYYGFFGNSPKTIKEIANRYHTTEKSIREALNYVFVKLKKGKEDDFKKIQNKGLD